MFCFKVFQNTMLLRNSCHVSHLHTIKEVLQLKPVGSKLFMQGWVRAIRKHKEIYFVDLVDGSSAERLQVLIAADKHSCPSYGSSIQVEGSIISSSHKGQAIELSADNWKEIGGCHSDYPFAYGLKYSSEYIRQYLHLRPRTRKFSSILRIRNVASFALHNFFQEQGFCFLHTPIITLNDCEGAGEVFSIKTSKEASSPLATTEIKTSKSSSELSDEANGSKKLPDETDVDEDLSVETDEYFGSQAYLTVSGQFHLEAMACAMGPVYNFGPTFRAENSRTRQHASEFSMVEAEIPFISNLDSLLEIVEKCIKSVTHSILKSCSPDLKVLSEQNEGLIKYIEKVTDVPFARMTYDEAVNILQDRKLMKAPINWGEDLSSECKRCLVHHSGGIPVFVSLFPTSLKPFYMKTDHQVVNSNTMAQCFDLFAPFGGEICGGSLREDQEEILRSHEQISNLDWYLDLRKYGSVPHGGFGIGFDRLLQSLLRISNIRDIIPFPRRKRDCKC